MPTPPTQLFKGQTLTYTSNGEEVPVLFIELRPDDQIMGGVPGYRDSTALVQFMDGRCFKTTMDRLSIPKIIEKSLSSGVVDP